MTGFVDECFSTTEVNSLSDFYCTKMYMFVFRLLPALLVITGTLGTPCDLSNHGQVLLCTDKSLGVLNEDIFSGVDKSILYKLDFSRNSISQIPQGFFDGMPRLQIIDFTRNRITSISKDLFSNLDQLYALNLKQNLLSELEVDTFHDLPSLQTLYLYSNQFTTFEVGTFDIPSLKALGLDNNKISQFAEGLFDKLPNLEILYAAMNQITDIPSGLLKHLVKLEHLNLFGNKITALQAEMFEGLSKLRYLHLNVNQISFLSPGVFQHLRSIEHLMMTQNQLETVKWQVFNALPLKTLSLSMNKISTIEDQAFWNLTSVRYLNLDINQIASISVDQFLGMNNLMKLDLHVNKITRIPTAALQEMSNLRTLKVDSSVCFYDDRLSPSVEVRNQAGEVLEYELCAVDPCDNMICLAQDQCHEAGVCEQGECSDPLKEDGTPCNDEDSLTLNDVCRAGICVGETNECYPNPCTNGGSCIHQLIGYSCECPDGYSGPVCDTVDELEFTDCDAANAWASNWPVQSIDDCTCYWGHEKQGNTCVKFEVFDCAAQNAIIKNTPPRSFDDCTCNWGFIRGDNICIEQSESHVVVATSISVGTLAASGIALALFFRRRAVSVSDLQHTLLEQVNQV